MLERDWLGVDCTRTVIVCAAPRRKDPQKVSGDHPKSKRMLPYYSTKESK